MNELPASSRPAPPPLRIHHLMACAVVLSLQLMLWRQAFPAELINRLPIWALAFNAVGEAFIGIGLTFAILSIYWQLKGYAALIQPGQWLLERYFLVVPQFIFSRLVLAHVRIMAFPAKPLAAWTLDEYCWAATRVLFIVGSFASVLLPLLFFVWCAWRVADTRLWRFFFAIAALTSLSNIVPPFGLTSLSVESIRHFIAVRSFVSSIPTLAVLCWIIASERRAQLERFWTHWLGVGLSFAAPVLGIASGLVSLFGGY